MISNDAREYMRAVMNSEYLKDMETNPQHYHHSELHSVRFTFHECTEQEATIAKIVITPMLVNTYRRELAGLFKDGKHLVNVKKCLVRRQMCELKTGDDE
jgi:hypothetical protein